MTKTVGRIDRTGVINFHDASLSIWEEGLSARLSFAERDAWERAFKRQVFARVVQALNRLGWTVAPWDQAHQYQAIANTHRTCHKGDLKGELAVSGRHIELKMWQGVNTPTRPDHGGRYEMNKEACMPYVLRLEMERTRRRIRDYLCNVFTGYTFKPPEAKVGLAGITAIEAAARARRETGHYVAELDHARINNYGNRSRDGVDLTHEHHGARVFAKHWRDGRIVTGVIFYSLNSQWQLVTGRYDLTWVQACDIWVNNPGDLRVKRNSDRRRKRLEQELARAVKAMDFDRAKVLRDILFPPGTGPVFHVRVKKDGLLWGPNSSGYTHDSVSAGKYTRAEAERIVGRSGELEAVEVAA
jgi:hypothetical protein